VRGRSGSRRLANAGGRVVPIDFSSMIEAIIELHRTGCLCHDWQKDMATRFGALGVYGDIGGALMIRKDGSVLYANWDEEQAEPAKEGWRVIALAAASYRFPELSALAPERPATARPCWKCGDAGCDYCFGMGWLPDNLG
jgi:hypothetical protein